MHPADALVQALNTEPEDVHALLQALPEGQLRIRSTLGPENATAREAIAHVERLIVDWFGTGTTPRKTSYVRSWDVAWHGEWWMLEGHLYEKNGAPDQTSPLLLVNRKTYEAIYGPELARLAHRLLAHSLAWDALNPR